jgi:hypothetical protein
VTISLHNRRKLEVAMRHLLDGTVTAADTKLTWKNVAAIAGLSKATADRAVDLRNEFRRQTAQQLPPPATQFQPSPRSHNNSDEELVRLRKELAELKESTKVLHSVILAMIEENARLARRRQRDDSAIAPLSSRDCTIRTRP